MLIVEIFVESGAIRVRVWAMAEQGRAGQLGFPRLARILTPLQAPPPPTFDITKRYLQARSTPGVTSDKSDTRRYKLCGGSPMSSVSTEDRQQ